MIFLEFLGDLKLNKNIDHMISRKQTKETKYCKSYEMF